jgi:hypothetical protein
LPMSWEDSEKELTRRFGFPDLSSMRRAVIPSCDGPFPPPLPPTTHYPQYLVPPHPLLPIILHHHVSGASSATSPTSSTAPTTVHYGRSAHTVAPMVIMDPHAVTCIPSASITNGVKFIPRTAHLGRMEVVSGIVIAGVTFQFKVTLLMMGTMITMRTTTGRLEAWELQSRTGVM